MCLFIFCIYFCFRKRSKSPLLSETSSEWPHWVSPTSLSSYFSFLSKCETYCWYATGDALETPGSLPGVPECCGVPEHDSSPWLFPVSELSPSMVDTSISMCIKNGCKMLWIKASAKCPRCKACSQCWRLSYFSSNYDHHSVCFFFLCPGGRVTSWRHTCPATKCMIMYKCWRE